MNKVIQREDYISRINKATDYIERNIDKKLTLDEIAAHANFSPFHFHRIFKAFIGETLTSFIKRLRIEKASVYLIMNPRMTITEVALECGFGSSASFARSFKEFFNVSATDWKNGKYKEFVKSDLKDSKICKTDSKNGEVRDLFYEYFSDAGYGGNFAKMSNKSRREIMKMFKNVKVDFETIEEFTVAYVRYVGPYKGNEKLFEGLFTKLFNWAGPRDLIKFPETKVLSVYHDNPSITDEEKLRTSVCISVPEETKVEGEVGKMNIPAGKYAVGHFELTPETYETAWDYLFSEWLPGSGYQCDDRPTFELYLNDPKEHPEGKHIVDIYVPIKPM